MTYLLDTSRGVWTPFDKTFLDIRVSHPNCLSNRTKTLQEVYEENEDEKKDEYLERVLNVEKATLKYLQSQNMYNKSDENYTTSPRF